MMPHAADSKRPSASTTVQEFSPATTAGRRAKLLDVTQFSKDAIASRTMLVGAEAMTAMLEVVVDPAVGQEESAGHDEPTSRASLSFSSPCRVDATPRRNC